LDTAFLSAFTSGHGYTFVHGETTVFAARWIDPSAPSQSSTARIAGLAVLAMFCFWAACCAPPALLEFGVAVFAVVAAVLLLGVLSLVIPGLLVGVGQTLFFTVADSLCAAKRTRPAAPPRAPAAEQLRPERFVLMH
jgi:hypothetical protein